MAASKSDHHDLTH